MIIVLIEFVYVANSDCLSELVGLCGLEMLFEPKNHDQTTLGAERKRESTKWKGETGSV